VEEIDPNKAEESEIVREDERGRITTFTLLVAISPIFVKARTSSIVSPAFIFPSLFPSIVSTTEFLIIPTISNQVKLVDLL
jgi:hypothetical protein